jgi:CRISPR/Cas system CSM-associated protein Csm4 (group 5 of RAMP superfamily)
MIYFIDTEGKASYTKSMKKIKYYTQDEYEKQLNQEKVFVNVTIATICYVVGLGIFYMSIV